MDAKELFWELAAEVMRDDPRVAEGTMFGGPCLRADGEFLAAVKIKSAGMVVKLPKDRVAQLISDGIGEPFTPAGKTFKEWVGIPNPDRDLWLALLREGVEFVTA